MSWTDPNPTLNEERTVGGVTRRCVRVGPPSVWQSVQAAGGQGAAGPQGIQGIQGPAGTTSKFNIGTYSGTAGGYLTGYVDEFRVSNGIARWTGNFTPPSLQYV